MPTLAQLAPLIRIFTPVLVGILTQYIGADAATQLVSVILTLLGSGGWSLYRNTASGLTQTVAAIPGVQVAVTRAAPDSVQKLANDPNVADVVPVAVPLPSSSPPKDPYVTSRRTS